MTFPHHFAAAKTLITTGDSPAAVLIRNTSGRRRSEHKQFPDLQAALTWCQKHDSIFIWLPKSTNPKTN